MPGAQIKTAVLGLDDAGQSLLSAASAQGDFKILAVADTDGSVTPRIAQQYNCAPYDDYRRLVIENQLDCLIVAAPIHTCIEYVRAAIKKKFNIIKLPPLARNFAEAAELVGLARQEQVTFAVLNPLHFADSFVRLGRHLRQIGLDKAFMLKAVANAAGRPIPAWQTDPAIAGGGTLLNNSFDVIHLLISIFDMPQSVFALTSGTAGDKQQRLYLTEDAALLQMRFSDTLLGALTASRAFGRSGRSVEVFCKDQTITACETGFAVRDSLDNLLEEHPCAYDEAACIAAQFTNFSDAVQSPDKTSLCGSAADNLRAMAVVEAAYLSARTGMPEQPHRILGLK